MVGCRVLAMPPGLRGRGGAPGRAGPVHRVMSHRENVDARRDAYKATASPARGLSPAGGGAAAPRPRATRSGARMEAAVRVAQEFPVDVRVDLRGGDVGVTEHLLDRSEV